MGRVEGASREVIGLTRKTTLAPIEWAFMATIGYEAIHIPPQGTAKNSPSKTRATPDYQMKVKV
jgi:hypothetical protein